MDNERILSPHYRTKDLPLLNATGNHRLIFRAQNYLLLRRGECFVGFFSACTVPKEQRAQYFPRIPVSYYVMDGRGKWNVVADDKITNLFPLTVRPKSSFGPPFFFLDSPLVVFKMST
ncbi:hypothetical protein CEXT_230091 [Caerostris extrusa]|uniref:Uncharacterized protein n=1 Tax=Caerostris extrusa TaxID=172846 RepID=A0AAV4UJM1_CAEEX|nr:hypothetical protein CEXT_230091 [Caerostris extrusa]